MPANIEARGRPPRVTLEQYRRIVQVRMARAAIPTDKELAIELGLNPFTVANVLRRGIRAYEKVLRPAIKQRRKRVRSPFG
jgi:hypothetical protein